MSQKKIYVVGHKNPDADSVCSAIAYAAYKNIINSEEKHIPIRCGNSNSRIERILEFFKQPLPEFVGDVRMRAEDIMHKDIFSATVDTSCFDAMGLMDKNNIRMLPVLDDNNHLLGDISVFDLGEFFIPRPREPRTTRHVKATLKDVAETLQGEVIHFFNENVIEEMYVRIGAMEVSTFNSFIERENIPPEKSLIVVGDRLDIQIKAIQMGVRAIIISGKNAIEDYVLDMAKTKNVSIIISPYDSATSSLLVRMATRITPLIKTNFVKITKEHLLSKISARAKDYFDKQIYVCDDDNVLEGILTSTDLIDVEKPKLILVDHNELSQAVIGAEEAEILEIIDHHKLGNQASVSPILFINKPVGSTCSIVSEIYRKSGIKPEANIAGILMGGIISDTLNLQSPTSTSSDAEELKWLEKIAGVKISEVEKLTFSSDSVILTESPSGVVNSDCKHYECGGYPYSVSQIEEIGFDNFYSHVGEIKLALENHRKENKLFMSSLLVTNVSTQDSLLIVAGSDDFTSKISYPFDAEYKVYDLSGIVSRKKQLVPYLTNILRDL